MDNFSRLSYVHAHETTNAEEAIEAKKAFEAYAQLHGVKVKHCHADNGIFNSEAFRDAVSKAHQTISFCGVGAHHQSGIAERMIRELSELARTQLLHAMNHNRKAISIHLWPYALRHASYLHNLFPRTGKKDSPIEAFSSSRVRPRLKHAHPFGCPVYVLQKELQDGNSLPRWDPRARVGIYLGHSPHHAASVGLILNQQTGLCSPQFHCYCDDLFETVKLDPANDSLWQKLAHFHAQEGTYDPDPKFFPDFARATQAREGGTVPLSKRKARSGKARTRRKRSQRAEPNEDLARSRSRSPIYQDDDDDDHDPRRCLGPDTSGIIEDDAPPAGAPQDSAENEGDTLEGVPPSAENEGDDSSASSAPHDDDSDLDESIPPKDIRSKIDPKNITSGTRSRRQPRNLNPGFTGQSHFASFITEVVDAVALAATAADPDTMTLRQALNEPDADQIPPSYGKGSR